MSVLPIELIKQTEQIELLFYAIFGLLIACIPFVMKLWIPTKETFENETPELNATMAETADVSLTNKSIRSKIIFFALLSIFAMFAVAINFSTNYFDQDGVNLGDHFVHWGAYISAAKSLDAGLAIFRDFPTQYGLGPSFLIALASRWFGWISGFFYIAGVLQLIYWISLTFIGFKIIKKSK